MSPLLIKQAFEEAISQGGATANRSYEGVASKQDIIGRTFAPSAETLQGTRLGKVLQFKDEILPDITEGAKKMYERLRQGGANENTEIVTRMPNLEKKSEVLDPATVTQGAIAGAANQYFQNKETNKQWLGMRGHIPGLRKQPLEGVAQAALGGAVATSGIPELLQQSAPVPVPSQEQVQAQ